MYPTTSDLAQFLLEAKIISAIPDPLPESWEMHLGAAIESFETDTGWIPFLGNTGDNTTRSFDICGSRLHLPVGLISLDNLLVRSDTLTEGEDFWLEDHRSYPPYRWIDFRLCHYGRRIVQITGVWGYTDTLPDDVRLAILSYAAMALANSLSGPGGEIVRVKQDDVQYDFASASGGLSQGASWGQRYKTVVSRYRRVQIA